MMRTTPPTFPPIIDYGRDFGGWQWSCTYPGCHETGGEYDTTDAALIVGQAHRDSHLGAA